MKNQNEVYRFTLSPVGIDTADARARVLLEGAQKQMGAIPNMYANMANFSAMFEIYSSGYGLFRAEGGFTPAEQEVVFLTISKENTCAYCLAAHSVVADMKSKVPVGVTDAIRNGTEIPDDTLKALSLFTAVMVNKKGRPSVADVAAFLSAGFTEQHILSIILAIAVKTISNYSNHIFHTPVDPMFKSREWKEMD